MVIGLGLVSAALAGEPAPVQIADSMALEGSAEAQMVLQQAWQSERQAQAKAGKTEWVRLPVTLRSQGWGCPCPAAFVGTSTNMFTTGPWLSLSYTDGLAPPTPESAGMVLVAEGRFLGTSQTLDLQPEGESIPEHIYTLRDFEVRAWRPWVEGGEDDWMVVLPEPTAD